MVPGGLDLGHVRGSWLRFLLNQVQHYLEGSFGDVLRLSDEVNVV